MTTPRRVRLVHELGSDRYVDEVSVDLAKKHLAIQWPTAGLMYFNFTTGLALGAPRGPWRLSDLDRKHYCELAGLRPKAPKHRPLKRDRKKQDVSDPRQLWLRGTDK